MRNQKDLMNIIGKIQIAPKKVQKKYLFINLLTPLNIAIGSGEYIEDFEKEIQKKALEHMDN
jgi:hypothetical protein